VIRIVYLYFPNADFDLIVFLTVLI
jgi:hypothetical protein